MKARMKLSSGLVVVGVMALGAFSGAAAQDAPGGPGGGGPGRGPPAHDGQRTPPPPAEGGTIGTVDSVSASDFAVLTSAGTRVTVEKASSTTYRKGTRRTSASAVKKGESVLVFGLVDLAMAGGTTKPTIKASQVVLQPSMGSASTTSTTTAGGGFRTVVAKQVGLIPPPGAQGQRKLATGMEADKAAEAALAAFSGGLINRVQKQSDSVYDVHNAAVSWPHNIYIDQDFKYLGAK
jgi:hypothetical protein